MTLAPAGVLPAVHTALRVFPAAFGSAFRIAHLRLAIAVVGVAARVRVLAPGRLPIVGGVAVAFKWRDRLRLLERDRSDDYQAEGQDEASKEGEVRASRG